MNRHIALFAAALALVAFPVVAGEWHSSDSLTNLCTDCHTMHFSQQHAWDSATAISTTPAPDGNWLSASGPNEFLLKAPANELCLACHNGQGFAPDVLGVNTNGSSDIQGRSAGGLNEIAMAAPYDEWKGHTLGSTAMPPGNNPTIMGYTYSVGTHGLECTNCHTQHGRGSAYRNLGPRSPSYLAPTYKFSTSPTDFAGPCRNTTAAGDCDVRINMASYTANSGAAATFAPYYDTSNVFYGRNDDLVAGTVDTSNRIDGQCGACHGDFHGGAGDANIQATGVLTNEEFLRHPTSEVSIGTLGSGHSTLTRYTTATTKVKTYSDTADGSDGSPGCITCHKAHGNQNPFGLVFLNRNAATVTEQGGWAASQVPDPAGEYTQGYRNLCGQCHGQGNN